MNKNKLKRSPSSHAFSLAEMLVVMLILTIVLAATMPILSKRAKMKAAAASSAFTLKHANEGDSCTDGTDSIAVSNDNTTLLTCMPNKTLGGSCTTIGAKAVDTTNSSGTLNPYVHLVCIN